MGGCKGTSFFLTYPPSSLLWSPTNPTTILQSVGEVGDFKPLFTCVSPAFFCNLNYAVCSKRNYVMLSKERDCIGPLNNYIIPLNITYAIRKKQGCNNHYKWVHQSWLLSLPSQKIVAMLTVLYFFPLCFCLQSFMWWDSWNQDFSFFFCVCLIILGLTVDVVSMQLRSEGSLYVMQAVKPHPGISTKLPAEPEHFWILSTQPARLHCAPVL